jgi:hypothetical protein
MKRITLLTLLYLTLTPPLRADTLSGTVRDPSGSVVAGARIEITGGRLTEPRVLTSDDSGKFTAPDLAAGTYSIHVSKEGFDERATTVELKGQADLAIQLAISAQRTSITVNEKSAAFANSDSIYRQLRGVALGSTYRVENFKLILDVGTFELKSGTLTFLAPVHNFISGAVFLGEGHFSLKPFTTLDTEELSRRAGAPTAEEDVSDIVFRFSPNQYPEFSGVISSKTDTPPMAISAFEHWKERVRKRHEVSEGFTESILEDEAIDNIDADILSAIYNPNHPAFINAYMHGSPHKDFRFFIRLRTGAIPQIDSPEEVGLINCDGGGMDDGIWYLQHLKAEFANRSNNAPHEKRFFATRAYNIETVIAKNEHLFSRATITFEPLLAGERVMKFGLLPNLRVLRVSDEKGQDIQFIQENRKQDGSFYAILNETFPVGQSHFVTVEYGGDKVLFNAGGGSYYFAARTSWYPNLNGFGEKALYDLTFKIPPTNVMISVGKLVDQRKEAGFAVSHWVTPQPIAVAGFNYGQYQKLTLEDTVTHYDLSGYYLPELPDSLRRFRDGPLGGMAPSSMTKYALEQARAQLQICTLYFGRAPYDNIFITEQPNFSFGQSWPNLVYLPISAYIDSTQRWMLFGHIDNNFSGFVQEVTPHEVAHQWFGHAVSWSSYHDQWLSEGFADFAAGLFLQQAVGPKWQKDFLDYWERQRKRILEKNSWGVSPNDAGPVWLGIRLISPHSAQAYQGVTYSKGAYILSMLRSLMRADMGAQGDPDQAFIDMMHDFTETHRDTPASTESFKAVIEKHMTKRLDFQQNGRMDWFFRQWVYGKLIPRYSFKYQVQPAEGGKFRVHAEITQSEVDDNFAMSIPIFADIGNGMIRLTQYPVIGNSTRSVTFTLDRQPKKIALNYWKEVLER